MRKISKKDFMFLLENAKLNYESEISWGYKIETPRYCLDFWQDEKGINHIEEFLVKIRRNCVDIEEEEYQTILMYEKLNNTPYQPVKEVENIEINDLYWYNGVRKSDFY
jgi:hypothetical protein